MKENLKTLRVTMLPTEGKSHLHFVPIADELGDNFEKNDSGNLVRLKESKLMYTEVATEYGFPPRHLYFISDEEIKESEYAICKQTDGSYFVHQVTNTSINRLKASDKKIEATTDSSLLISKGNDIRGDEYNSKFMLPQIPIAFVEAYAKSNGAIKEVQVEMEITHEGNETYSTDLMDIGVSNLNPIKVIKTRPDNTVIVHIPEEKRYSREDLHTAFCAGRDYDTESLYPKGTEYSLFTEWFENFKKTK